MTLDFSGAFYRPDAALTVMDTASPESRQGEGEEEAASALRLIAQETSPTSVDFSRKHATTYLYTNILAGRYVLRLH